jgi:hypothetical protein
MSCDCNTLVVGEAGVQGPQGLAGINGDNGTNGLNAYTTVIAPAQIQPSVGSAVTFYVAENRWIAVGQTVYISQAGFYRVTAVGGSPYSAVTATLIALDDQPGYVPVGGSISVGRKVSPSASAVYSAPLTSLTVNGDSGLNGNVIVNSGQAAANFRVDGDTQQNVLFVNGTTSRVGVLTSGPQTSLDVNGTFRASDTSEFIKGITINSSNGANDFIVKTSGPNTSLFVNGTNSNVGIRTTSPDSPLHVIGETRTSSILVNPAGSNNLSALKVLGAGGSAPLNVDSTNNRVGIKTTTPTVELDVVGAAKVSSTLNVTGQTQTASILVNPSGSNNLSALKVLGAGGAAPLNVDSTNNRVGIKTTTPTVELDVVGAAKVSTTLNVTGAATLSSSLTVGTDFDVASSTLKVNSSNNRVGINTGSPAVDLDIVGDSSISGLLTVNNTLYVKNNNLGINASNPTSALDVVGDAIIDGDFVVSTDDLVVDTTNHRVGVNQATPVTALDVNGIAQASGGFRVASVAVTNAATLTRFSYVTHTSSAIAVDANESASFTITSVTNTNIGDFVQVSYTTVPTDADKLSLFGYMSAAGEVTVVITNGSTSNVASQTYAVAVLITRAVASS